MGPLKVPAQQIESRVGANYLVAAPGEGQVQQAGLLEPLPHRRDPHSAHRFVGGTAAGTGDTAAGDAIGGAEALAGPEQQRLDKAQAAWREEEEQRREAVRQDWQREQAEIVTASKAAWQEQEQERLTQARAEWQAESRAEDESHLLAVKETLAKEEAERLAQHRTDATIVICDQDRGAAHETATLGNIMRTMVRCGSPSNSMTPP